MDKRNYGLDKKRPKRVAKSGLFIAPGRIRKVQ